MRLSSPGEHAPQSPGSRLLAEAHWISLCFLYTEHQPSPGPSMLCWVEAMETIVLPQTMSRVRSLSLLVWDKQREHLCFDVPLTCNAKCLQIRLHTVQELLSHCNDHLSLPEVTSLVYIVSKCAGCFKKMGVIGNYCISATTNCQLLSLCCPYSKWREHRALIKRLLKPVNSLNHLQILV